MAQAQPIKKNRYCWMIFVICCFAGLCGVGLISNTYGLFMGPIAIDLGFKASQVSLIMTIASWITVAFYYLGGKAFAKFGPRWVSGIAGIIIVITMIMYSRSTQIWHFYLTAALCGATGAFAALNVVPILITNWFIKYRSTVMGIAYMMTGIGGALWNPLFASIITKSGNWRDGYVAAAVAAAIYPILALIFLRNKPSDMGLQPLGFEDSEEMKNLKGQVEIKEFPGISKKNAWKAGLPFVMLFILFNAFGAGFNQHWVNCGVSYGNELLAASFLATAAMLSAAVWKVIGGVLNDKIGPMKTAASFSIIAMISMVILMIQHGGSTHSLSVIAVAAVVYGAGVSLTTAEGPVYCRELFGMKEYGLIYPFVMMAMSCGTGLTYSLNAVFLEMAGSYMGSFIWNFVVQAIGCVFAIVAFKYGMKKRATYWEEVGQAL